MDRVVDISTDGLHLARFRGFLTATRDGKEVARIPFDQINAVMVHAHGVTYSHSLLAHLSEQGTPVVICGSHHSPTGYLLSTVGHHRQAERMQAQINASLPLKKQLWKQIVIHKIRMQASLLNAKTGHAEKLPRLAADVGSGDPNNREAEAARVYWPALMGAGFTRDRDAANINSALNYGYTILRSAIARHVVAAGLHPTIGIHHRNTLNGFALCDDLIEPFRPLVDACVVREEFCKGFESLTTFHKQKLAAILEGRLQFETENVSVNQAIRKFVQSLVESFQAEKAQLNFFKLPTELEWSSFGGINERMERV